MAVAQEFLAESRCKRICAWYFFHVNSPFTVTEYIFYDSTLSCYHLQQWLLSDLLHNLGFCVSHAVLFVKRIDYITAILATQANSIA